MLTLLPLHYQAFGFMPYVIEGWIECEITNPFGYSCASSLCLLLQCPERRIPLQRLSREGFRDVQRWLVSKRLATSQPYYQLTVTPEAVATELEKS